VPTALLTWELGGGVGHCVNLQPVANGLLARGWEVWVAVRELPVARKLFGAGEVKWLQAPFLSGSPPNLIQPALSFTHILHNIGFGEDRLLEALLGGWQSLFEVIEPDILVCEHAPTALLASRWFDVRRVVMGTGFFSPPNVAPMPDVRFWVTPDPGDAARLERDEAAVLSRVNRLLERSARPRLSHLAQLYADVDANYLISFAELDHYPQRLGGEYWGMWSPTQTAPPSWPEGAGPRVFAYLKPMAHPQALEQILAALNILGTPCLAYLAGTDLQCRSDRRSAMVRLVDEPVNVREVAETCDAVVLNGNAGTATEFLLAGIPQLHIPNFLEQAVLAKLVERLGAGLTIFQDQFAAFSNGIESILHDRNYRDAAQRFSHQYSSYDPAEIQHRLLSQIDSLASCGS
jgi:hypothetical protein